MGYMLKHMIEHYTDEEVELINNLGSSTVVHQAMLKGDANVSATRYTGTDITGALNAELIKDPAEALAFVQKAFQGRHNQTFFDSCGFENTYAFMVSQETAEQYNLNKISDLAAIPADIEAGVDTSWLSSEVDGFKDAGGLGGYHYPWYKRNGWYSHYFSRCNSNSLNGSYCRYRARLARAPFRSGKTSTAS